MIPHAIWVAILIAGMFKLVCRPDLYLLSRDPLTEQQRIDRAFMARSLGYFVAGTQVIHAYLLFQPGVLADIGLLSVYSIARYKYYQAKYADRVEEPPAASSE